MKREENNKRPSGSEYNSNEQESLGFQSEFRKKGAGNIRDLCEIKKVDSTTTHLPKNRFMKMGVILSHPFSACLIGGTGSGKTNLLVNMLTRKEFYKGYFKDIFIFTPSPSDGMLEHLISEGVVDEDHIISEDMIEELNSLIKSQEEECKKSFKRSRRTLVIFEDVSSNHKLMNSKSFKKCFVQNRHLNMSCFALFHKYKILPRMCRLNSHGIFFFKSSNSENEAISEDHCPPGMTKQKFLDMIEYATTQLSHETNSKPFLFINTQQGLQKRYNKTLGQAL